MWPSEFIELKHIEDLLVCGICYEYMETSVITLCSHNYCSLCIRKYLHYKTECPACFAETFEKDLRKNKVLDEIIAHFSRIKDKLKRCLTLGQVIVSQNNKDDNTPCKPKLIDQNKSNTHLSDEENKVIASGAAVKNNASLCTSVQKDLSSPSTSGKLRIPLIFTPKSHKRSTAPNLEDTKVVICPVCKVTISELKINRHLDDCLKRETIQERPQMVESRRKPLPKLVFSLMKDAVIRKKLKELGLSSQGDRKALEARLQRYIVLYNAECDKLNPRPVSDLLKQCEDEENLEKKINKTSSFVNRLQVNRNTEQNIIDDERKKYLEVHKDSFESLITRIKGTDTQKKSSVRRSILDESVKCNESIPYKRQAVDEDSSDTMEYIETNNVYVEDSDSDDSCPLQTYSSTDPMRLINVAFSSSCDGSITQNESTPDRKKKTSQEEFKPTYYSPAKIEKHGTSSQFCSSNVSMLSNKETGSIAKTTFNQDMLKHNSKDACNTPKKKVPFQRRAKVFRKGETKSTGSVTTSVEDFKFNEALQQEEIEDGKITPSLQDLMYNSSSNDSIDYKSNYGRQFAAENGILNDSRTNFLNVEKENISSSPECTNNHSFRKRSRDFIQNDSKALSSTKKKIRNSTKLCLSETEESHNEESVAGILHGNEDGRLRKKLRLRKQDSNIITEEGTTVLRKSTRTKSKNNVL